MAHDMAADLAANPLTVSQILKTVDYSEDPYYIPTEFALHFTLFIKLVNGGEGEENSTPDVHLKMLDTMLDPRDTLNMIFRGAGKTAVFAEYGILYNAVFGEIAGMDVDLGLYVSDSIENGVNNLRKNLEH